MRSASLREASMYVGSFNRINACSGVLVRARRTVQFSREGASNAASVQQVAEARRLGTPVLFVTNPRNHYGAPASFGIAEAGSAFSQWPGTLGLAATRDAALVEEFEPDSIAIERVFSQQNVRTAMGTAQAAAMGLLIAGQRGIPVALHTPTEVKAAVTGSGRAEKAQVTSMVTRLLRLPGPPKPADAAVYLRLTVRTGTRR